MTRTLMLLLLGACSSDPPIALELACAEGQRATEAWPLTSLAEHWERSRDRYVAVLARRAERPELVPPTYFFAEVPDDEPIFYACVEAAEHEVIDGLGWIDTDRIVVASGTGEGFFGTRTGRPLPDVNLVASEHFYADHLAMAADENVYLLLLELYDEMYIVRWRTTVSDDGVVSGENTTSGEPTNLDVFRR